MDKIDKMVIYYPHFGKVDDGGYASSFNMKESGIADVDKINEVLLTTHNGKNESGCETFGNIDTVIRGSKKEGIIHAFASEIKQIWYGDVREFMLSGLIAINWITGECTISVNHTVPIALILRTSSTDKGNRLNVRYMMKSVNYDKISIHDFDTLISQISDMRDTLAVNDKYNDDMIRGMNSDLLLGLNLTLADVGSIDEDSTHYSIRKKIPIDMWKDMLRGFMGIYLSAAKVDPTTIYTHRSAVDLFTKYIYLNFKKDEEDKEDE